MIANVGGYHSSHSYCLCGEVTRHSADVKAGDAVLQNRRRVGSQVALGDETGNQASQSIARTTSSQTGIASRINKNAAVRRSNQTRCALQENDYMMAFGEVPRCCNSVVQHRLILTADESQHFPGVRS